MDQQIRAHLETLEAAPGDAGGLPGARGGLPEGRPLRGAGVAAGGPRPGAAGRRGGAAAGARPPRWRAARPPTRCGPRSSTAPCWRATRAASRRCRRSPSWPRRARTGPRSARCWSGGRWPPPSPPRGPGWRCGWGGSTRSSWAGATGRRCATPGRCGSIPGWSRPGSAASRPAWRCGATPRPSGCSTPPATAGAERVGLARDYARLGATLADQALFHDVAMDSLIEAQTLDRAAPGAAEARERLTSLPRRWREEAASLEARAATAPRREAAELLLRAAQLQAAYAPDGLGPAVDLLERAWALAPGQPAVLELLERVLEERKDFGGHAAALERLAAATRDRGALVQLHLAAARLKLVRLGDAPGALAALARALELDPACEPAALQSFEQLADAGRFAEALAVLERHLEATPERPGHALLRVRAAELARARLGDPERAQRHLEAALRADPGHAPAAAALAPLLAERGEWSQAGGGAGGADRPPSPTPPSGSGSRSGWPPSSWSGWSGPATPSGRCRARWRSIPRRASVRTALEEAARRARLVPELCRALRSAAQAVAGDPAARRALLRRSRRAAGSRAGAARGGRRGVARAGGGRSRRPRGGRRAGGLRGPGPPAGTRSSPGSRRPTPGPPGPSGKRPAARWREDLSGAGRWSRGGPDIWRELLAASADDLDALWGLHAALEATPGAVAAEERTQVLARLAALVHGAAGAGRAGAGAGHRAGRAAGAPRRGGRRGHGAALRRRGHQPRSSSRRSRCWSGCWRAASIRCASPGCWRRSTPRAASRPSRWPCWSWWRAACPADADPRERARHLLDASVIRAERLGDARGALTDAAEALRAAPDHAEARKRCEQLARQVGAQAELYRAAGRGGAPAGGQARTTRLAAAPPGRGGRRGGAGRLRRRRRAAAPLPGAPPRRSGAAGQADPGLPGRRALGGGGRAAGRAGPGRRRRRSARCCWGSRPRCCWSGSIGPRPRSRPTARRWRWRRRRRGTACSPRLAAALARGRRRGRPGGGARRAGGGQRRSGRGGPGLAGERPAGGRAGRPGRRGDPAGGGAAGRPDRRRRHRRRWSRRWPTPSRTWC